MKKMPVLMLLLSLSCSAFAEDNNDVDRLYERLEQQDVSALTTLTKLAKHANSQALSVLGFVYEFGVSVPKDTRQAIRYYQQACALGGDYGCYNAGYFYQYGIGVPEDQARAGQLLGKINVSDIDINITKKIGDTLYKAKAQAETDAKVRVSILKYASRFLNSADAETLRIFSRIGFSKSETLRLAKRWALQGDPEINFYVGHFYNFGYSSLKDKNIAALRWFRRAAEGGEPKSQNILGLAYREGRWGVNAAPQEAITWFERAAQQDQDNDDAIINLAEMYYTGEGVDVDYSKALTLFIKAHEMDLSRSRAAKYLAWIYFNGQGMPVDCQKAWQYRTQTGTGDEKADYIAHCINDNRAREQNRQTLPKLTLKADDRFLGGSNSAMECENYFIVDTDQIGEITNLHVAVKLTNTEGVTGKYLLTFAPFGMNTMNESLNGQEYSSFRSSTRVAEQNPAFCQSDFTIHIDSATARINGQEKDLLAANIIRLSGDSAK
ncbi:sel1 repeat family protein [Brenneria sp. 4F2]|nr:sel1 repeat family protein [Brenneria bubanii]